MERMKHHWFRIPVAVRKPLVLIIGAALVIISPFTGVLPGPGGIPIFLLGIAILSTEFEWAQRLRDWVLVKLKWLGAWWRAHKVLGTLLFALATATLITASFLFYRWFSTQL